MSRWCDQSIHDTGHSVSPNGPQQVACLFGPRVAETILASVHVRAHQQAGHMDASDLIKTLQNTLQGGDRPHMGLDREPHLGQWSCTASTDAMRVSRRQHSVSAWSK